MDRLVGHTSVEGDRARGSVPLRDADDATVDRADRFVCHADSALNLQHVLSHGVECAAGHEQFQVCVSEEGAAEEEGESTEASHVRVGDEESVLESGRMGDLVGEDSKELGPQSHED